MVKKKTYSRTETFHSGSDNTGTFFLFFSVSALFHLMFFAGVFFAPDFAPKKNFSIAAINVNLVTIADSGAFKISQGKAAFKTPIQSITQKAYKKSSKTVSLAPARKKVKKSLKKKHLNQTRL